MGTKIEWTKETWNLVTGCDKCSAGCINCYAITMSNRLSNIAHSRDKYAGTVKKTKGGKLNWTGKINLIESELDKPGRFKKPTFFFSNSMSDLFHEKVPFEFIDKVYNSMRQYSKHYYLICTKRDVRMLEYYHWKAAGNGLEFPEWPLPNLWMMVTVENQENSGRIQNLMHIPAAVRAISMEPLLNRVNIEQELSSGLIHWVIAGGESGGNNVRPLFIGHVRYIRRQCEENDIPFFFKQWGRWLPFEPAITTSQDDYWRQCNNNEIWTDKDLNLPGKGTNNARCPANNTLINQCIWMDPAINYPGNKFIAEHFLNTGKQKSGNLLDGKKYQNFPKGYEDKFI